MALNATIIKNKLSTVPSNQKDNQAQSIINGASAAELKSLSVEGVLRLYEALAMLGPRIFSSLDAAALKKLKQHTQFQAVGNGLDFSVKLIKQSSKSPYVQSLLTPGLVKRLYAAERKRLSWFERVGIDGATIGRGQLSKSAYVDVKSAQSFKKELALCLAHAAIPKLLNSDKLNASMPFDFNRYEVVIPTRYARVLSYPMVEDFVVAAFCAISIKRSVKPARSAKDAARFALVRYHGMNMVRKVQKDINETINWAPVEKELLSRGYTDEVAYINEVVK